MKSKLSRLFAIAALFFSAKAMASLPKEIDKGASGFRLTPKQLVEAIAELEYLGVIENIDGHFILKDESALEQLRKDGRLDLVVASQGAICF